MGWVFLWLALALATQLWLCFRVARSSVFFAIGTFFLGGIAAVYTLFKERGEPETSVTTPFIANLVFTLLLIISSWQLVKTAMLEQDDAVEISATSQASEPGELSEPLSRPEKPMAAGVATAANQVQSGAPLDVFDAFSAELRNIGIVHSVTRAQANAKRPGGVVDSAQIDTIAATSGSNAGGTKLSATLFRCNSTADCRNAASAYMHQSASRVRVLQNGALLLVLPTSGGEFDGLSANLTGAFRKLQP